MRVGDNHITFTIKCSRRTNHKNGPQKELSDVLCDYSKLGQVESIPTQTSTIQKRSNNIFNLEGKVYIRERQ